MMTQAHADLVSTIIAWSLVGGAVLTVLVTLVVVGRGKRVDDWPELEPTPPQYMYIDRPDGTVWRQRVEPHPLGYLASAGPWERVEEEE